MKNLIVLICLGCLLNGATLLQDTVNALIDETVSLRTEVKVLKDKIKTLESSNLDGKDSLNDETVFTKNLNIKSTITMEHLTPLIKNNIAEVNSTNIGDSKKLEFGDVMIFAWHANIRKGPSKQSSIMDVYDIGSLHSVDITYMNNNWFKLSNGYYLSKRLAQTIDKNSYNKVITLDRKNNLRIFPIAKKEFFKTSLQRNTILYVYPKKVADVWYVTQEHAFIYAGLVKVLE
jgi:hypothetical protein